MSKSESSTVPDLQSKRVKIALAYKAYQSDIVRLALEDVSGYTHLLASRQGLYVVDERRCTLLAHGFFFGLTLQGNEIYAFECCDLPRALTQQGRIVRLTLKAGQIVEAVILAKGLENGCHQIDFIDGRLHVLDTYNQALLRFAPGEPRQETLERLHPVPPRPPGGWQGVDPAYRHINTLLAVGDRRLLMLHNGAQHTGRTSEIAVFDPEWREVERWPLQGTGCHGLALLEDGSVLTCGSMEGKLLTPQGWQLQVSPYMTRGLAVGADGLAVGASRMVEREGRMRNSGTVTFMNRDYTIRTVLEVPGAPMELRRLDGQDFGLSGFLSQVPWGHFLAGVARR